MIKQKIWIDIITPSDVHFFSSLIKSLNNYTIISTIREKAETMDLVLQYKINHTTYGKDYPNQIQKYYGIFTRTANLMFNAPKFDISMGFQNGICSLVSKFRKKKCIMFDDNDYRLIHVKSIPLKLFIEAQKLADSYIVPKACFDNFKKVIPEEKLIFYHGFKEDIYIANFIPNENFLNEIPFEDYIVIRPEALDALYVSANSIEHELINRLNKENFNIIFLPREKKEHYIKKYKDYSNIFIPKKALNGLDLCYHSKAVLTGSGTLAREAVCMGKTAISFFPSDTLLSVDRQLTNEGKMFHSRNPKEIVEYVLSNYDKKKKSKLNRSKIVKEEVVNIIKNLMPSG